MTLEHSIYLVVFALWLLTLVQGLRALWDGVRFYRYVRQMAEAAGDLRTAEGEFKYQPKAAIILPCCGVDEKLEQTVQGLARQDYADYEVIFTFESAEDPAYGAVGAWVDRWSRPRCRRVVAGRAERRSQKIHNLLAAVEEVSSDREVLAFLDSDVVPAEGFLGHLVAPLQDRAVGAATGYRWYSSAGGLAAGVRCAWNAAMVTMLHDEEFNFCWGGATAIRKETFDALAVADRWDRALSDDYQLTRALRQAGRSIRFVPQALVPSSDRTTWRGFWSFARRQVLITRVCAPAIWRAGLILTCSFLLGGTALAVLIIVSAMGWFGNRTVMLAALLGWISVVVLGSGKALLRQLAIRRVLAPPHLTWKDFCWDVGGTVAFSPWLHLHLLMASLASRRILWRNIEYELVSADETRIVRRVGSAG
jgi:cellulose synthase/poly-beta-1,6-N-acetylglucosamine synthase-like glycosyltransferase